ncbi:PAS domain S-box protein [Cognatilysobacter lacus]|uniref:PAS domain S-box protein n=1 Tax=Cognatilysobacter lacus TaxID=1643323 RepID=UPI00165984CF|nr:PAS domain S-box protein [Lysobacter lacus]
MAQDFDGFDANPVPMFVFDMETLCIVAANPAAAELYGWPQAEMRGLSVLELRPPGDREKLLAHLRLPAAERPTRGIWVHRHRGGTRMHVEVRAADVAYGGRAARLVVARDVSESELTNARVHLIAQAMSDAAYDCDVLSGDLWFSDGFATNFGFTADTVPTTLDQWAALVHPDERVGVHGSLDAAIAGGASSWVEEYCFQRGDGTYTEVLDRGYIQRDGHGTAARMVGGMIDRRPQRLLSPRLRLFERAVEASTSGILIADAGRPAFPIAYANPAFEHITGYRADEVEGRAFDFLQAFDPQQAGAAVVRDALQAMTDVQVSSQGTRRDGSAFWYEYRITPMRDSDGRVSHLLGVITDTSERQRHAQQLQWRSTHDVLTRLPNRHLILEHLAEVVQRARTDGGRVSVLIVDLDGFKLVNDGLGHAAGDRVLCEIALRLHHMLGPRTLIGRSVGDEFVIIVEGDDDMLAEYVASGVHAALIEPVEGDARACKLTASVGYSHFSKRTRVAPKAC